MARIIVFVQGASRLAVYAEKLNQKQGDPFVDSWPDAAIRRIKGVVEVEDPGADMAKASAQRLVGGQAERRRRNQGRHGQALVLRVKIWLHYTRLRAEITGAL